MLGDVAAKIEAARYFCWKGAHYLDQHDFHGELIGAMNKILCTEMLLDCVYKCMQVVGVNSVDKQAPVRALPARGVDPAALRRRATSACSAGACTA